MVSCKPRGFRGLRGYFTQNQGISPVISPLTPVGVAGYAKTPCFFSSARMYFKNPEFLVVCEIPGHNGLGCAAICRDMPPRDRVARKPGRRKTCKKFHRVSRCFTNSHHDRPVFPRFSRIPGCEPILAERHLD